MRFLQDRIMFLQHRPSFLVFFTCVLLVGCFPTEEPGSRNGDTNPQNVFETDTEEQEEDTPDLQEDLEDINEELNHGLQGVQLQSQEGGAELTWSLTEDHSLTAIRITASPAELMWGEATRMIDPTATSYFFDKLVNDIQYTFEIQAFSNDEEVGEPLFLRATPFSRPLLAIGKRGTAPFDIMTRQPASGWETYIEQSAAAFRWSPDGTKLFTILFGGNDLLRCTLFDRATREEIQLPPSDEMNRLCVPQDLSWSPDSRHVAFTRRLHEELPGTTTRITYSVLDTQTGEIESDWPDPFEIDNNTFTINSLDWSPDGERLALSIKYDDHNPDRLMMINTSTKEIEPDWITIPYDRGVDTIDILRWSPDSKRLAVSYSAINRTPPVYHPYFIINAETKEIETDWPELTRTSSASPFRIVWSPDGELLVLTFPYSTLPGEDSIQVINTSTRENVPGWPTDWLRILDVAWSHDSQSLAISSNSSPYLLIVDRASKTFDEDWTPLTEPAGGVKWSPQHSPPAAPIDLHLTHADIHATLSWNPPDNANILDYRITIEPQDQVDGLADYLIFDPTATEYTIEGLNPEIDYNISLRAIDVFGVGEAATYSTL